jgi:hypothetical protein
MKNLNPVVFLALYFLFFSINLSGQGKYKNFKVSVYTRAYEVQKMKDPKWLDSTWTVISSQLDVDKIYLETHRDMIIVDPQTLEDAKRYFESKGLEVAGGITYTIDESNFFKTYCYTKPADRQKVKEIIEYTASHFNEVILDDFFFTSCKCSECVKAKGDKSWSEYRLDLMTDAAKNLVVDPAKKVNPNVKVIIKYPNWYDHFQEMGFNLETQPGIFDGVYTGTETRDAVLSEQHLQPYLGYLVYRYYNNLAPGRNGGGWVDPGGMNYYDRYAEQLWLTILAKAPEITFFDYRQLIQPLQDSWMPKWKNQNTSFNYNAFLPVKENSTIACIGRHSLDIIDKFAGELGNPYGIKSYKPYHSSGEDFLENYLGMIGIPIDLVPDFPVDSKIVLLTEHAKKDSDIVNKIKQQLLDGNDVIVTSGLLNALQDRGIRNLVNLEYTSRKSYINEFMIGRKISESNSPMLIPQIQYNTNDSWEIISGMDNGLGWPLLHQASFANGTLYLLTIPENFEDLYNLPQPVLDKIRETFCKSLGFELRGGSKVSVFLYDNNSIVLESFNDEAAEVEIVLSEKEKYIYDIIADKTIDANIIPEEKRWGKTTISPQRYAFKTTLPPHSFKVFQIKSFGIENSYRFNSASATKTK